MTVPDPDGNDIEVEDDLRAVRLLLAGTDPAPPRPACRAEQQRAAQVLQSLRVASWPRWRRRRPHVLVASAAAVTMVALLLAVVTVIGGSGPASAAPLLPEPLVTVVSGDHAAAVNLLQSAAAHQRTAVMQGVGPVRYTLRQTYGLDVTVAKRKSTTTAVTYLVAAWRRPDGSEHIERSVQQIDRAGQDVGGPEPAHFPHHPTTDVPAAAAGEPLPADPARLRATFEALFHDNGVSPTDTYLAEAVVDRLREGDTDPSQNAALFDVLAETASVYDAGPVRDRAGRDGHAIGVKISGPESLATAYGYLILSDDGTPLTVEVVYSPAPPPGLRLPA
ncbi:hypothetical protein, partial [Frankia canadensis]|uniref:hypothetical protein n=1 Tax=Frankia canadensis TaxID=1836972 RepID=UPI000C7CAA7F